METIWDNNDGGVEVGPGEEAASPTLLIDKLVDASDGMDVAAGNPRTVPRGLFHRAANTNIKAAPATAISAIRIEIKVFLLIIHITFRIFTLICYLRTKVWDASYSSPPDSNLQPISVNPRKSGSGLMICHCPIDYPNIQRNRTNRTPYADPATIGFQYGIWSSSSFLLRLVGCEPSACMT